MVLAVNEAMANAAEYAYVMAEQPGAMHVLASYDGTAATLTVTVTDEGAWRSVDPAATELRRGRGIPLMHALADHATVDSSAAGTRVSLEWSRVAAARARALELRQPHDLNEELVDLPYRAHELVEIDRFGHVGVGVQLVAAQDVLLRRGGREHDHRDMAQIADRT